jgi:hypothetical protein
MIPPCDIGKKIVHELVWVVKGDSGFHVAIMSVISLAALIVVAQHANPFDNVGQTVFEEMRAAGNGFWQAPQLHFDEGINGESNAAINEEFSFHVGDNNNT